MEIAKIDRTWSGISEYSEVIAYRKEGIERLEIATMKTAVTARYISPHAETRLERNCREDAAHFACQSPCSNPSRRE